VLSRKSSFFGRSGIRCVVRIFPDGERLCTSGAALACANSHRLVVSELLPSCDCRARPPSVHGSSSLDSRKGSQRLLLGPLSQQSGRL
jgi:hypothetical protein